MNLPRCRRLGRGFLLVALAIIPCSTGIVLADPLGLVRIDSREDAAEATAIMERAFVRIGNKFLVAPSSDQLARLAAANIEFEIVMEDFDPNNVYQVINVDHPRALPVIELDKFGQVVDLDYGTRLMTLSRAEAASVSESPGLCAVKLAERHVPIFFPVRTVAAPLAADYPSDSLAARVNKDSLHAYVQRLEEFRTRYPYTDSCRRARIWIDQKLRSWGYYTDTTSQRFIAGGWWQSNVVAAKPGLAEPDKVIVIGGHYDSFVNGDQTPGRYVYAPGADDDASGVALTMEIARVLADVPLRKTVIFIPFAAEEIGLVGSTVAADYYQNNHTKLEVMYNFDMIANTEDTYWDLDFSSGDVTAYRDFSIATALRISDLIPQITFLGFSSDHYPFDQNGFAVVDHIESDFSPNWHLNTDVITEMNFDYFTEVTKTALVSLAVVADAAYPVAVDGLVDAGDGHSLEVSWSDCSLDCEYTLYWGSESGQYSDSADVPVGQCSFVVGDLVEGDSCFVLVVGEAPNGYRALHGVEGAGVPLLYPRVPSNFAGSAVADQLRLVLSWGANVEGDLSHYNVYRRIGTMGVWGLYAGGIAGTSFVDTEVAAHVGYEYAVTAVDRDGYESGMSAGVLLYPATFDGGLVIGDGFVQDESYNPDQAAQEAWLDTILSGLGYGLAFSDENGGPVTLSDIGQYNTLIWCDDDIVRKNIGASEAGLEAFAAHNTRMLISGYRTWADWSPRSVPVDHLLYQEFGLSYYELTPYFDFIGAVGQNGWPSVVIDPTRGMEKWRDIPKLTPVPGAEVLLTFDSWRDLAAWEGQPVALAYETVHGKRVLFGFPLYFLTPASAQALLTKVMEYFGLSGEFAKGDLDHSGTIDIVDITVLLDHLFISMRPLEHPELADVDTRPGVSIGDVFVLINYLFLGGPAPAPGR